MHPSQGRASSVEGFTHLSTDSEAADLGFHSGQNFSSDNLFSSTSSVPSEASVDSLYHSGNQKQPVQQHEDSHTFDSGVDLDSSQQSRSANPVSSSDPMKVEDLCIGLRQMHLKQQQHAMHLMKWEKYFQQNDDGDTYLHLAVIHEATDAVYNLINAASRPWLDIQNDIGQTPLHLSVLTGQPKIVRKLVVAGAKTGIRDVEGNTPLHLACLHRMTDCAKELLTPLDALELQQGSRAAQLVNKIPQDLEQWNYNGKRCVHIAAETSNIEILRHLVRIGADINSREGKSGQTPLHIAIESSNEQLANFLLDECPKLRIEQVTYAGLTAYQLAALQHNQTLLNWLKKHGAEPLMLPESDDEEEDSEEDELVSSYSGSNAFGSNFAGLSTINVA
ncbi:NF-kappa-B inhibitor cactus-like [Armigeres subalbatus]|uniref:NF-kappa-B inhibitor cactus-like n=1 Tax=Armigeres subalbatus TaxID=124917 RepID=UPI002ED6795C